MKSDRPLIFPFLIASVLALLMGLWAGLLRIGWQLPVFPGSLPVEHGPLMISGFLGTLVALERVAALRQRWMFAAPLLSGVGWVASLALPGNLAGPLLITLGSLFATAILLVIVRRETKIYTIAMAAGVSSWLVGNLFWVFGAPVFQVVWIWAAFLILTIAGERLELSRVLRFRPWQYWAFSLASGVFLAGAILNTRFPLVGSRVAGAGMLALAAWLLRFDIARRNRKHPAALTRFIATCLYGGFIWLAVSAVLVLALSPQFAGPWYDAELHAAFVGFVFSMIFGHSLIILPALIRVQVPFRRLFYLPLVALHISLLLRVAADLAGWASGRMWGGLLNEVAILAFIAVLLAAIFGNKQQRPV